MGKAEQEGDARMKAIGDKFRKMRKEAGYSSYDNIAWDLGISRNQISRIERGENITIATLLTMVDAHGISLADFFSDFTEPRGPLLEKLK